jgi:hypothetical protein
MLPLHGQNTATLQKLNVSGQAILQKLTRKAVDMDMSYTRVLHIKVAYRGPHK